MTPQAGHDALGKLPNFTAVIPAGGTGTRLWPLSRASRPKFLLDLAGTGQSMLADTMTRLRPLAGADLLIVTGRKHANLVVHDTASRECLPILVEPEPRNSMPAIGLAAAVLERQNPESIIGAFPADHIIDDIDAFLLGVERAYHTAQNGYIVTLGISPSHASTGFGYIEVGPSLRGTHSEGVHAATGFREKPDQAVANTYLQSGKHLWNAGIFVARASTLLDLLNLYDPNMTKALRKMAQDSRSLGSAWQALPSISIDHALAEPATTDGHVAVVPTECGWDDVGDFASLLRRLAQSGKKSTYVLGDGDSVIAVDSSGLVIPGGGRLVAVLGLDDVIVVDTPDALLVASPGQAQKVGALVDRLRASGRADLA